MTDATELLSQLRDIKIPEAPPEPSLWPVFLSILLLATVITTLFFRWKRKRAPWKTRALQELEQIERLPLEEIPLRSATLLKRIALTHNNDTETRTLTGEPWLKYLDRFYATDYFTSGTGQLVAHLYSRQDTAHILISEEDKLAYVAELKKLIEYCRSTPTPSGTPS